MKSIGKIKILVAALAGVFAWSAVADVQIGPGGGVVTNTAPFMVNEPTVYTGATNIYTYSSGYGAINANLTLQDQTYLRLVGKTSASPECGIYLATNSAADINIDIKGNSAFYGTYRNSEGPAATWGKTGIDPKGNATVVSYMRFRLGVPSGEKDSTGRAKITVASAPSFGSNASFSPWFEYFFIESSTKPHDTGYIDFLQIDKNSMADITHIEQKNKNYPARILFNGGALYNNYMNSRGNQLSPDADTVLVLEGINGNDIILRKEYMTDGTKQYLNGGAGTLRFQGDCDVVIRERGENLPGVGNGNRNPYRIDPSKYGPIEWKQNGDIVIESQGFLRLEGDDVLPYGADEPILRLSSNGILDLDGHSVKLRSLIADNDKPMVTNVSHSTYTSSKLVFGAENTDGIFSAKTYYGVSAEKVGTGTLVVSNATMDVHNTGKGLFTVKAGTVILVGTNKIGDTDMFESDRFIIEEGATVIREVVINVASGETTTDATEYVDGANSVKVRIRKTGVGTLVLSNGANTFSGGLVIDEGTVKVTAAGAQGAGKIIINCTASKNAQIKFAGAEDATYANDIEVTGKNNLATSVTGANAAICIAQKKPILTGKITAVSDLCIADSSDIADTTAIQNYTTGTFNGEISVGGDFYCTPGGQMTFNGKITANAYYMQYRGGCRGWLKFTNSSNKIGTISFYSDNTPKLYVTAAGAVGGAAIEWQNTNTYQAQQRGTLDATYTGVVSVQSLNGPNYLRKTNDVANVGYSMGNNSSSIYTLKITGREDVDTTRFCGGLCNTNMSLELASRAGFTQVFSNVYSKSTKELKVTSGTLVIAGASYFPGLTTITVEDGGVLDIRELGWVADAQVDQYPSLGAFPGLATINIASTAKIKLAEGVELKAATVKVDGFQLNADTYSTGYSAATLPWIEGAGTIKATANPTMPVTAKDAVWSGAGADTLTTTAANWTNNPPPAFYYLGYRPVFGEGGDEAVFPTGTSLLNGIAFNRAGDFTVRGADENTLLKIGKNATIDVCGGQKGEGPANTPATYTVDAPISIDDDLDMWVPTNKTLRLTGGFQTEGGVAHSVVQKGTGTLELVNARFKGGLQHNLGGLLRLSGDIGVVGDNGVFSIKDAEAPSSYEEGTTKYYRTVNVGNTLLDNAVVHKPTTFGTCGQVMGRLVSSYEGWFSQTEGSTNVFCEFVKQTGSMRPLFDSNATVIFEKGYGDNAPTSGGTFNPGMKKGCTNSVLVFNGPLKLIKTDKTTNMSASVLENAGLTLVFGASSNVIVSTFLLNYYKAVCAADDAFVGVKRIELTGTVADFATAIDLQDTYQRIADIHVNSGNGVITGEYPATIDFTSVTNGTDGKHNFCPKILSGWVKLAMSGTGYQIVGQNGNGFASQSYGDIEVSNGTLELMPQTTWLNGTNFIAKGEGKLKLSATDKPQVGPQAVFHFADNGKVEIPAGVTVSVAAAFVREGADETAVSAGTYDVDTKDGPMAGRVTGGGKLRVRSGMMLILR